MSFRFLGYEFARDIWAARFRYESAGVEFCEEVEFAPGDEYDEGALERALFLAMVVCGTSYYKVRAGRKVEFADEVEISKRQAEIFSRIYQEGMGQYAYENGLTRGDLAEFVGVRQGDEMSDIGAVVEKAPHLVLALVSGGKDSLLAVELMRERGENYRAAYITSQESYPEIVDKVADGEPVIIKRRIDQEGLMRTGGMNGHVPVTLINEALALVQAILLGCDCVEFGIGREGLEPHVWVGDLAVNHQWSKTMEAQELMREYVRRYVTDGVKFRSLIAGYNELQIVEIFTKKCWEKYGDEFSSCNVANYKLGADNRKLSWCGKCAKCANSYLLFAPFVEFEEQEKLFGRDLFLDPDLADIFQGLLGVGGVMKPFECVASIDELRWAYQHRLPGYGELLFAMSA